MRIVSGRSSWSTWMMRCQEDLVLCHKYPPPGPRTTLFPVCRESLECKAYVIKPKHIPFSQYSCLSFQNEPYMASIYACKYLVPSPAIKPVSRWVFCRWSSRKRSSSRSVCIDGMKYFRKKDVLLWLTSCPVRNESTTSCKMKTIYGLFSQNFTRRKMLHVSVGISLEAYP